MGILAMRLSVRRPTMIGSTREPIFVATVRRELSEVVSGRQELVLDLGLPPHTFGDVSEVVGDDFGFRSVDEQTEGTVRAFLPHEANRLQSSREKPILRWNVCHLPSGRMKQRLALR